MIKLTCEEDPLFVFLKKAKEPNVSERDIF